MATKSQRELKVAMGLAQLAALALFPLLFFAAGRDFLKSLGAISVGSIVLVVALLLLIRKRAPRIPRSFQFSLSQSKTDPTTKPELTTETLVKQLRRLDWYQFEKVVALAYRKKGYTVTRKGGANPDGGIDLIVEKNGVKSAIQCKQWKTWNVGVKAVREFLGALTDSGIQKGILVTLCGYTGEAKQLAQKREIEIVNESGLAGMLDADRDILAILEDKRKYCPKCEREMVLRRAGKGQNVGTRFWGCSAFPRCRFTMPVS